MALKGQLHLAGLCLLYCASPVLSEDAAKPTKPGGCVDVTTEAAFASVGYDHIVTLKSGCAKPITCSVKTDVNPESSSVQLDPGETESVVTWRGSPAREFKAHVVCAPPRESRR